MSVHLEGMGVIGSILARCLNYEGVEFTWSDSGRNRSAWQACTGAVYPGGDARDEAGRDAWLRWRCDERWAEECSSLHPWVFCTKKPPHGARAGYVELTHGLRCLDGPSVHVNAQHLVRTARDDYDALEGTPEPGAQRIVTHGWSYRRTESVWGWMVPVALVFDPAFADALGGQQPALYFRRGRFIMAYAYPIPRSSGLYYAGSSLIVQKNEERPLEVLPKFERWRDQVDELSGGAVRAIQRVGDPVQGWRPRERDRTTVDGVTYVKADHERPLLSERDGVWYVRPHWNSGVRHAPLIVDAVLERLGLPARSFT